MRWSDGVLFTAADFLFAVESNLELHDKKPSWLQKGEEYGDVTTEPLPEPLTLKVVRFDL